MDREVIVHIVKLGTVTYRLLDMLEEHLQSGAERQREARHLPPRKYARAAERTPTKQLTARTGNTPTGTMPLRR
jgi:hypothetical protein